MHELTRLDEAPAALEEDFDADLERGSSGKKQYDNAWVATVSEPWINHEEEWLWAPRGSVAEVPSELLNQIQHLNLVVRSVANVPAELRTQEITSAFTKMKDSEVSRIKGQFSDHKPITVELLYRRREI